MAIADRPGQRHLSAYFKHRSIATIGLLLSSAVLALCQNPIQLENAKSGSPDWQLTNPATNHEIEGYASAASVNRGGQISFFVNTSDPAFTLEVFRMGWYGGAGARRMMAPVDLSGTQQVTPAPDPTTGMVECQWTNPYTLQIPYDASDPTVWASGVYLVRLTGNVSGKQSFIIFIVRDDNRSSTYLYQLSMNTFEAYNNWGGKSLYNWNSTGAAAATQVSFNRPFALGNQPASASGVGAGEFLTNFQNSQEGAPAGWAYNMLRFLEREGYDVSYIADVDAHENGNLLLSHKTILIVGHSEYWSWQMRMNLQAARDAGVSIGSFSSNTCYWQVRFSSSPVTGAPDRTMICYKSTSDPYASNPNLSYLTTVQWRQPPVNLPEDALFGVMWAGVAETNSDIIVVDASHWAYTYTGLNNGDHLPGLLGYEIDDEGGNQPANTVTLAHEIATANTPSDTTIYQAASGAFVFATGSFQWSWGLDDYNVPNVRNSVINPAAQQITRNLLARLAGNAISPALSIVPSPRVVTVDPTAHASASYTVSLTAFGYSPTTSLSVSGLPANTTYSFSPSRITGSGSSTLTITPSATAPLGSYIVTINANDGTQTRTEAVTLILASSQNPDFSISATPASNSVGPGGSTSYTVNVTALSGFSDVVNLEIAGLPAGASAFFSPASITGSGTATLNISTQASTPGGNSTLVITGQSQGLTHSAQVTLTVTGGGCGTGCGSGSGAISIDFVGSNTNQMGSSESAGVVAKTHWNNASGASSGAPLSLLDENGATTSATVSWTSANTWNTPIADQAGNSRMMRGYLDTGNGNPSTITVSGLAAGTYNIYVYADGDNGPYSHTGIYQLSGPGIATTSISLIDAPNTNFAGTFTQGNSSAGNYVLFSGVTIQSGFTLTATPGATDNYPRAPVNGIQIVPASPPAPDFTLTASPSSQTVSAGGNTTYSVNVGALNGFSGTVSLAASGLPSGTTASFNPASLSGSGSSTLTLTTSASTPAGSSTVTITGTSGSLTHSATVTLVVSGGVSGDFTLSASPSSQTISPGGNTTYSVNIGALNGFSGTVNLTASGLPSGTTASFNPASLSGSGSSTLTLTTSASTPAGSSTVTITGTSGSLTHSATVTLVVSGGSSGDFTLSASPSSQTVSPGGNTTYSVNIGALNGFSGTVSLAASSLPSGTTASFNPASLSGSGSSTLTLTTSASTPAGSSTVTITGTSGSLTHSATVILVVSGGSSGSGAISIDFVGSNTNQMGSSESAGVVAKTHWNNASGASSGAPLSLLDENGATTSATVSWTSANTWNTPITDQAGNSRMMRGYLDTGNGNPSTITVSGLAAGTYNIYVYADGDNGSASHTGIYQLSGPGIATTSISLIDAPNTNFAGTFTQGNSSAGNYVLFSGVTIQSDFTLTATPGATDNYPRAPVNGIQIIPASH